MADRSWNPWKLTAMGMVLAIAVALVTGLVMANWTGRSETDEQVALRSQAPAPARPRLGPRPAASAPAPTRESSEVASVPAPTTAPTQTAIAACNDHAASVAGPHEHVKEVVKDGAIGAAGGAIAGGGKDAGTGAAIGGLVGAGGGTLWGLNENRRHEERYRDAYASCMRARGYFG